VATHGCVCVSLCVSVSIVAPLSNWQQHIQYL